MKARTYAIIATLALFIGAAGLIVPGAMTAAADSGSGSSTGVEPQGIPGIDPHGIPGIDPHGIPGIDPHGIPGIDPH